MQDQMQGMISSLLSPWMVLAAGAIWFAILMFNRMMPASVIDHPIYQRFQPLIPEALGIWVSYMPGLLPDSEFHKHAGGHIVIGLWIGLLSSKAYKVISQSVLGQDEMINGKKEAAVVVSGQDVPAPVLPAK
jgi:hypothetical protein